MKKAILFTLLSVAFCASASADQYLYWMIEDTATLGGEVIPAGNYTAKIGYFDGNDGGSSKYLSIYTTGGSMTDFTSSGLPITVGNNIPSFAKISVTLGSDDWMFIELLNDGNVVGNHYFSYASIEQFLTATDGMAVPAAGYFGIGSFTPVPEPTSGLLMLVGLAGLALRRKHKKV